MRTTVARLIRTAASEQALKDGTTPEQREQRYLQNVNAYKRAWTSQNRTERRRLGQQLREQFLGYIPQGLGKSASL